MLRAAEDNPSGFKKNGMVEECAESEPQWQLRNGDGARLSLSPGGGSLLRARGAGRRGIFGGAGAAAISAMFALERVLRGTVGSAKCSK